MLMIVAHHFSVHSGFSYSSDHLLNKGFLVFCASGGKIGVSVFVIITGYFLIHKGFSLRKLGRFIVQVWGYSLAMVGLAWSLGVLHGGGRELVRNLLPLGYMSWFAHAYLLLFILTPFINSWFRSLEKSLFRKFLILGFFMWYFVPTITGMVGMRLDMGASILMDFIFLYGIGAYIRLYGGEIHINHAMWKTFSLYLSIVFLNAFCNWIHLRDLKGNLLYFADINSALMLVTSVYLFLAFKQLRIGHSRFINGMAATTFGIYLIHDNNLLRHFLWHGILPIKEWYTSPLLPLYAVITVLVVFSACGFIDFLRFKYLEPRYSRWVDRVVGKWGK